MLLFFLAGFCTVTKETPWSPQQPKPVLVPWPAGPLELSGFKTPKKAQTPKARDQAHQSLHHSPVLSLEAPSSASLSDTTPLWPAQWPEVFLKLFWSPHGHGTGGVFYLCVCVRTHVCVCTCLLNISIENFLSSRADLSVSFALIFTERQAYRRWFFHALYVWLM